MHPNLFHIGPLTVHSYGLFLALAFITGLKVATYYGKKEEIPASRTIDLVLYIFIAALIGAKVLHVVVDFSYYSEDWRRLLNLYQVGGVYYGGLILAVVVSLLYMRYRRLDFWRTADALCMGVAAGQILGRIGCFLAGCCWGRACPADFPLAVIFRNPEAADQVGTPLGISMHPTQLYEASGLLAVFLILVFAYRLKRFDGQQFLLYLLLYSTLRFTVEFFRGDPRGSVFGGILSTSQFISILLFAGAIAGYLFRGRTLKSGAQVLS